MYNIIIKIIHLRSSLLGRGIKKVIYKIYKIVMKQSKNIMVFWGFSIIFPILSIYILLTTLFKK
jgi:hypothetical protein